MAIRRQTYFSLPAFVLFGIAFVQALTAQNCPKIELAQSDGVLFPGRSTIVSVVDSSKSPGLAYEWSVSSGTIVNGQKTGTVKILAGMEPGEIMVRVVVSGLPLQCPNAFTQTIAVVPICVLPVVADEFGVVGKLEARAIIDNIFVQLSISPTNRAFFRMSFMPTELLSARRLRIRQILDAIAFRKYDLSRIDFEIIEEDNLSTRIYIVPPSAASSYAEAGVPWIAGTEMSRRLSTLFANKK